MWPSTPEASLSLFGFLFDRPGCFKGYSFLTIFHLKMNINGEKIEGVDQCENPKNLP